MQHHAAVDRILPRKQPPHLAQLRRFKLGHKADVADIDAEQRQLVLRRRPSDAQHGAVAAEDDRRVREPDRLRGFHIIERHHLVMQLMRAAAQLIGQNKLYILAVQLLADRGQNGACALLAQIGVDEDGTHQLSSSSCA